MRLARVFSGLGFAFVAGFYWWLGGAVTAARAVLVLAWSREIGQEDAKNGKTSFPLDFTTRLEVTSI